MCRYHSISARLLDIAHLLESLRMLPLHDVTLDDVKLPRRRGKKYDPKMQNSEICTIKVVFNVINYLKSLQIFILYNKRVIALISANIVPRLDIYERSQARVLRYLNSGQYQPISVR